MSAPRRRRFQPGWIVVTLAASERIEERARVAVVDVRRASDEYFYLVENQAGAQAWLRESQLEAPLMGETHGD